MRSPTHDAAQKPPHNLKDNMSISSSKRPVVFVHGLWLHGDSWQPWIELFRDHGYTASAASWPGDAATTEATRRNPAAVAGHGVAAIAEHIAMQLQSLPEKPILIGHSFGGLLVQQLLGRNLAAAAIAIDPAPAKGIREVPFSALKSVFPVLRNPLNWSRSVALTEEQFRYGFANAVSANESRELYERYAVPAPARPVFEAAMALFNPAAATRVNVANGQRGPLLLVSGSLDKTVPPVIVASTLKRYSASAASTELKEFGGRGHSLVIDSGWPELALYALSWLDSKQLHSG
jgi:non-heme chloroperoxidase